MNPSEALLAEYSDRWNQCEGPPGGGVLRLAVLRDLSRELHAEKSRCLAEGRRKGVDDLRPLEARIDELRNAASLESAGTLESLVASGQPIRKRTRLIPVGLFAAIPRDRLERFDRLWEGAIAAEACARGWSFWILQAWVEIALAEDFHRALGELLWPRGVILFAESAAAGPTGQAVSARSPMSAAQENRSCDLASPLWAGLWTMVFSPDVGSPEDLRLRLSALPGGSEVPAPASWKLVFTPKAL